MIVVTGGVRLATANREAGFALGCEHSRRSRAEPGCITHLCLIDAEDPDRIVFYEEWADMDALRAHFAVPESGAFMRQLVALGIEAPMIRLLAAEEIPAPQL